MGITSHAPRIIERVSFPCNNILINSSNVYSRPLKSITVYKDRMLYDFRKPWAGPKHPLQSTAIPHIIRG